MSDTDKILAQVEANREASVKQTQRIMGLLRTLRKQQNQIVKALRKDGRLDAQQTKAIDALEAELDALTAEVG